MVTKLSVKKPVKNFSSSIEFGVTQRCRGRNFDRERCCTSENPCDEGEGDCDIDSHCAGFLCCGNNNCKSFGDFYHEKDDCCMKPVIDVTERGNTDLVKRCRGRNFDLEICCTNENPCVEGEGDCEVDNDCTGNLVCGNNNCKAFGSFFHEKDDCCVKPVTNISVQPISSPRCRGRNFDRERCCTSDNPCVEGEGDCEVDNDCSRNLVCGNNNCKAFGSFFHEKDDCCVKSVRIRTLQPVSSPRCRGRNFDRERCCTSDTPCVEGEGDCEVDNDCSGNLICGNNNCKAFGSFFHQKDDCCIKPPPSLTTPSFPLSEPYPGTMTRRN